MGQPHSFEGAGDDKRFLSRREIISATVADALVMIANMRITLLSGAIAGALAPMAFIIPVGLAVGLFPIFNAFLVALMAGGLLFAIVLTPLVILSGFWERMRTLQVIEIAAALIILIVIIVAGLTIYTAAPGERIGLGTLFSGILTAVVLVVNLSPVVIGAGLLGTLMAALRRLQAHRDIYWRIIFGPIVSVYFGPHQVLSAIAVPVGLMIALGNSIDYGWQVALGVFPVWFFSGILFGMYWDLVHVHVLGRFTGRAAWFRKSVALAKVLEDDSYLFGIRFESVGVDPETGIAQIRAEFRDPDQVFRARQVAMRVAGITDADVVDTTDRLREFWQTGDRS